MTYQYHRIRLDSHTTRDEHRLVVDGLLGRRLRSDEVVHHINGDVTDNRPENLEITNRSEHARMHQRGKAFGGYGEGHVNAKLTESQVRDIHALIGLGMTLEKIAGMFGVSRRCIRHIKSRTTWKRTIPTGL